MTTTGPNLAYSDEEAVERDALPAVFGARGGAVHPLGHVWDAPLFDPATTRVYGADSLYVGLQLRPIFL